jgi:hypothetical protein
MTRTTQHLAAALATIFLLALATSSASARNLSLSNQNFRVTWTSLEFTGAEISVLRCPVTLEGSFHARTIVKARALIGALTRAVINQAACSGGIFAAFNGTERYNGTTSPNTLPWHVTYDSFTGTLPNISTLRIAISRFRFGLRDSAGFCTGQYGNETDSIVAGAVIGAGREVISLTPIAGSNTWTLIRRDGGIFCPGSMRIDGTGNVTLLGAATRITVTLI